MRSRIEIIVGDITRLDIDAGHGLGSIALPAISTGVYGFPAERAAKTAVRAVRDGLDAHDGIKRLVFACFSEESAALHRQALDAV